MDDYIQKAFDEICQRVKARSGGTMSREELYELAVSALCAANPLFTPEFVRASDVSCSDFVGDMLDSFEEFARDHGVLVVSSCHSDTRH